MEWKSLKPLIKWTGGKSNEYKYFKHLIPDYERYIEPFFGGGAVFFKENPKRAIINDKIPELIQFYRYIQEGNQNFRNELFIIVEKWEILDSFIQDYSNILQSLYVSYRDNVINDNKLDSKITQLFATKLQLFDEVFSDFLSSEYHFLYEIIKNKVILRMRRIKKGVDQNKEFTYTDIDDHVITAFKSAFYTYLRYLFNKTKKKEIEFPEERFIAIYYFLREFCFGGMFRESQSGGFNIPYGGQNYNKKNFSKKVEYVISEEVRNLFKNTQIQNTDFEIVIKELKLTKDDFMFIDPPYDSVFSKYGNNSFSRSDHRRLANVLSKTKSNFVVIIKETPFILDLYSNKNKFDMSSFEKTYTSNIKSRYNRDVKHQIITNSKSER